jgi:hypothetical protein
MTSLLDIGPLSEEVNINGKVVHVHGVTPEGFFYLLDKFPTLASMFGGGVSNIDMTMLQGVAPQAVAFALAVATTDRSAYPSLTDWKADVEKAAIVAQNLSAHYQMNLFNAALRLTFPDGIGPFLKGVEGLADSINRLSPGVVQATTSSKRSRPVFTTDSRGMRLGPAARSGNSTH